MGVLWLTWPRNLANADRNLGSLLQQQQCRPRLGVNFSRTTSFFFFPLTQPIQVLMKIHRYNKYTQIAARAVRQSLKEDERVLAEKRGVTALRYQHWEGGKGGEQVR